MRIEEIKQTSIWQLYEKGRNYLRLQKVYDDTNKNYNFYIGKQWEGAKLGDVEPVTENFISPTVKFKVSVIHNNLFAINYSSQNYESREFQKEAVKYCEMLNRYAAKVWENQKMDFKGRRITKDACINDEGILYVDFDKETMMPVCEVIKKCDIYYGNENDDDIQNQPYILIRKRMPVSNAVDFALRMGMSEEDTKFLIGDNDTFEESGEDAREELDNMVTIIYKMYKLEDSVHFSVATKYVEIAKDLNLGIKLYPVAHFLWEEREGSARGEGEVRRMIPNQIEVNRIAMRRIIAVAQQAFPKDVVDINKVANPQDLNRIGVTIKTKGQNVDDVNKVFGRINPATMSPDVKQLEDDLIQRSRDLAGAGDVATGSINPEDASGRAILAVAQASQAPMTEQTEGYKNFIEDFARIQLEYLTAYSADGLPLEDEVKTPNGETIVQVVTIPQAVLQQLKAVVKIDVTPKSVYDRFAQEQTLENLLLQGMFHPNRLPEFKAYVKALPDDSVAPKMILEGIIKDMEEEQQRIAQIQARAEMLEQRAMQYLHGDLDTQSSVLANAMMARRAIQ